MARGRSRSPEDIKYVGSRARRCMVYVLDLILILVIQMRSDHHVQVLTAYRSFAGGRSGALEDVILVGDYAITVGHMIQALTIDRSFARFRGGSTEDVIVLGGASTRMTGILDRSFMPIVNSVVTIISMGCDHCEIVACDRSAARGRSDTPEDGIIVDKDRTHSVLVWLPNIHIVTIDNTTHWPCSFYTIRSYQKQQKHHHVHDHDHDHK